MAQLDTRAGSLLLMMGLFLLGTTTEVQAQPTFSECKIFLIASDTARDLSLNKDPEYVRFLNLVARTFLIPHDFDTYDTLPVELQTTYKSYAWTTEQEFDISAAMFGAPATDDQLLVLENFCNQTSSFIASTVEVTESPTWAPTGFPEDETLAPTPPLSFDVDSAQTLPAGSTAAAISELPIQCRRGIFGSDADRDGLLGEEEYTTFVNRLSTNAYAHAAVFTALPPELQDSFNRLADDGKLNVFGAIPSQWAEATQLQQQFLKLICYRTEAALVAAHEAQQNNSTQPASPPDAPQIVVGNQTSAPSLIASGDGHNPTDTTNAPNNNEEQSGKSKGKLNKNAIAAIVGSILLALLGMYLARDKTDSFKRALSNCKRALYNYKLRGIRVRPHIKGSPSGSDDTRFSEASLVEAQFDVESLQNEITGFLEDQRIGALSTVTEETSNEESGAASGDGRFESVRFNPDEYNSRTGELEEENTPGDFGSTPAVDEDNPTTDDFDDYGFDGDHSEHSDDMSLFCNSIAGEGNRSVTPQTMGGKSIHSLMGDETIKEDSISTAATDLVTEFPSPRRSPKTQYHANRFGRIAESESKTGPSRSTRTSGNTAEVSRGSTRPVGPKARSARLHKNENRSPRRRATSSKDEHSSAEKKESSTRESAEPVDRFLRYARGESKSSKMSSDIDMADEPCTTHGDSHEDITQTPDEEDQGKGESDGDSCFSEDYSDPETDLDESKSSYNQAHTSARGPKIPRGEHRMRAMLAQHRERESGLLESTLTQSKDKAGKKPNMKASVGHGGDAALEKGSGELVDETESSSFLDTSGSSSFRDLSSGRQEDDQDFDPSDIDSTYEGSETESSFDVPVSSSESEQADEESKHANVQEIHELVAKVMPAERGNVTRMLEQYRGRENELLNTLRRLKARVNTKRDTGRPIHVSSDANAASTKRSEQRALLERASVMAENAELLAAAVSFGPSQIHGVTSPYFGANSCDSKEEGSFGGINLEPSTDIDDDDFSKDSTYFEDQASQSSPVLKMRRSTGRSGSLVATTATAVAAGKHNHDDDSAYETERNKRIEAKEVSQRIQDICGWIAQDVLGHVANTATVRMYAEHFYEMGFESARMAKKYLNQQHIDSFAWMKELHKEIFSYHLNRGW